MSEHVLVLASSKYQLKHTHWLSCAEFELSTELVRGPRIMAPYRSMSLVSVSFMSCSAGWLRQTLPPLVKRGAKRSWWRKRASESFAGAARPSPHWGVELVVEGGARGGRPPSLRAGRGPVGISGGRLLAA